MNILGRGPLNWFYIPNIKALGPVVTDKKIFSIFSYISLCKICDPLGWGNFWPQGHNLNKLGRGPLDDAIKALGHAVSEKKIFKVLSRKSIFCLFDLDMQLTRTI